MAVTVLYLAALFLLVTVFLKYVKLRYVYLTLTMRGPSIWELLTVHAEKLSGDELLTHLCNLCYYYSYKPWGLWSKKACFMVFFSDPDSIAEVFKSKNLHNKPDLFYRRLQEFLGKGSLVLNGEEWKMHRKTINPLFRKAILESNMEILTEGAENIVQRFRQMADGSSFEIHPVIDNEITYTAARAVTSRQLHIPDIAKYTTALTDALAVTQSKIVHLLNGSFEYKPERSPPKAIPADVKATIKEIKLMLKAENDRLEHDTLQASESEKSWLNSMSKLKQVYNEEESLDESFTLIVAASETTTTAIKAAILLLALHPDVQDRLYAESLNIFESRDQRPTPQDLDKMDYLGMVIKETLRLFPSGPILIRKAAAETNIRGTIIPSKVRVVINIMALHRNPECFKDPLKFIPERFHTDSSLNRHPYSYIPFSAGARSCVGQIQAMLMMKIVLSSVVRNFKILPGEGLKTLNDIKVRMHVTLDIPESVIRLVNRG